MKPKLLIAVDAAEEQAFITEALSTNFDVLRVCSVADAKDEFAKHKPIISVIDTAFDQNSGIELCETLSKSCGTEQCHSVVLSDVHEPSVISRAFQHGVTDYIFKPLNRTAFEQRILRLSRDIQAVKDLAVKDAQTSSIAEIAMAQASAYGKGMELVSRLNHCHDARSLAIEVLQSFTAQGFHGVIQLRDGKHTQTFDADATECDQEEHEQMTALSQQSRIFHYGNRSVFNDEHASILIKNMPSEGTRSYDAMLDLAAKLIPAINGRYIAICEHRSLLEARDNMMALLSQISADVTLLANDKTLLSKKLSEAIKQEFAQSVHTQEHVDLLVSLVEKEVHELRDEDDLLTLKSLISNCLDSIVIMSPSSVSQELSEPEDADIELF